MSSSQRQRLARLDSAASDSRLNKIRVGLNLYNLINDPSLIGYAGAIAAGAPPFGTDPGCSGLVSLSVSLFNAARL